MHFLAGLFLASCCCSHDGYYTDDPLPDTYTVEQHLENLEAQQEIVDAIHEQTEQQHEDHEEDEE